MPARKTLAEMTDHELDMAMNKAVDTHYEITKEQHRRTLIEEYGAENPELTAYSVEISVSVPLTILARDEADAVRIAQTVWLIDDRGEQITYDDAVAVTIEDIELNEEMTNARNPH